MEKSSKLLLLVLLIMILLLEGGTTQTTQQQRITIMIDMSHGDSSGYFPLTFDNFVENMTLSGFNVNIQTNNQTSISADVSILIIPKPDVPYAEDQKRAIKTWFETGGKLLWIAGDSDFGGYYRANTSLNPLLEFLGANLRLSWDSIDDVVSNAGATYRVLANQTGASPLAQNVTKNVDNALFHGPASVLGWDDGPVDLRFQTVPNATIDIIISSSRFATSLDSDITSNPLYDYYANDPVKGGYPLLVSQVINNSMLLVSGEAIMSDYQSMYDTVTRWGYAQSGKVLVDNLMLLGKIIAESGNIPFFPSDTSSISTSIRVITSSTKLNDSNNLNNFSSSIGETSSLSTESSFPSAPYQLPFGQNSSFLTLGIISTLIAFRRKKSSK